MQVPEYSKMDATTPQECENITVVQGLYDQIFNARDIEAADKLFAANFIQHNPLYGTDVHGFKKFVAEFFLGQFPDLNVTVEAAVAQNNRVMFYTTFRGHQAGTGQELDLEFADVYRLFQGRLTEHWDQTDYTELAKFGIVRPENTQPCDPIDKVGTPIQLMNLHRLRQYMEEVTIADLSRAHLYVADDFVQHTDAVDPGLAGFIRCFEAFTPVAPDLEVVSTCIVAGTHSVGAIWTGIGHQPETGHKFVLPTADIYRMDYGMLTEHWGLVDYTFPERLLGFHPKALLKVQ